MSPLIRGLLAGGIQLGLIFVVAGKYAIDRATLPRVWVKAAPYDPQLPVRGRYVRLSLFAILKSPAGPEYSLKENLELSAVNNQLIATPTEADTEIRAIYEQDGSARLQEPVAFFIPEGIPDPSRRPPGEELWAEVTVPKHGPPRPLRLGVKALGVLRPLDAIH